MRHCCVDDPVDLCTVNISGQGLLDCREEDFALFENVAFINAAENLLMPGYSLIYVSCAFKTLNCFVFNRHFVRL